MYTTLNVGKTGIKAMQFKMDSVADDLANLNTTGYKSKEISFEELLNNNEVSIGSKSSIGKTDFKQGTFTESRNDYHMAIEGKGFFGIIDQNDTTLLTRNGAFHIDMDSTILDDNGNTVAVEYYIPAKEWNVEQVVVATNGEIKSLDGEILLGKILLYYPENLDTLVSLGEGRYLPNEDMRLYNSVDNKDMFGDIHQHYLEESNVDIIEALADMISTQRAYSLNSKAIQTTDDIMNMINGIKR